MIVIEILALVYFSYVVLYSAFFSIAAFFYKTPLLPVHLSYTRFCVLLPAYKEDAVILSSARQASQQFYPKTFYDVVVIADGLKPATIEALRAIPVRVVEVEFEQSTKVKSLNEALRQLGDNYDYAVVLDADNLMKNDFLKRVNNLIQNKGHKAIQGQRAPKNLDKKLSMLDGLSEAINNHIYRQGATAVNLSASINGSGIAIQYGLFKRKLAGMDSIGGFDRELEVLMMREGVKVYYYKDAIVFDEKVEDLGAFQNQRRRWISSQYFYLKKYFYEGVAALSKGHMAFFNSAVLRNIQLPRFLNIGLLFVTTVVFYFLRGWLSFGFYWWPALFAVNLLAIVAAIPRSFYSLSLLQSLSQLPVVFLRLSMSLLRLKGANKQFLHTPHGVKTQQS